jgi:putative membrane-bound dehydrogenase-like protein
MTALVLSVFAGHTDSRTADDGPPYSPERSMQTMQLQDGFRIELVASEPDVQSPVAMDIDEDGRMFVVEMPGYPLDVSPSGRIKLLEDRDDDGNFETARVFADSLVLPTGVMRWKRGLLVTAAPDVLYLEDTDNDGRADHRRVVLTGFPRTNPQHTVNSPLYGLDNWIYVANQGAAGAVIYKELFGDRGTRVSFPDRPNGDGIDRPDSTVRFRPDTYQVEATAGESQFGHSFDAYGRYFGNDNSHHLWHEVLAARYLRRNPHLLAGRAVHDVPDHGAAATVFSITRRPTFELLTEAGEFTSACAPTLYLGGAFPRGDAVPAFVAEPVHNLIHRDEVAPSGATFTARRAMADREFLAAADAWFRPVNLYVGPEGALYIVDYYRGRIEHPEWTSSHTHRDSSSMYEGRDRGRIYRITHESMAGRRTARPRLGQAPVGELVAALNRDNLWWRRTAQRLLVDRQDASARPLLEELARERHSAAGRLHALWTLHASAQLQASVITSALKDEDPGVRENAITLAELSSMEGLASQLEEMAADPDARVRFQVLAALGGFSTPEAVAAHERLLLAHVDDEWMQIAGLTTNPSRAPDLLDRAVASATASGASAEQRARFVRRLAAIIGARSELAEIAALTERIAQGDTDSDRWWRAAALHGLADGTDGRDAARPSLRRSRRALLALAGSPASDVRRGALRLLATVKDLGVDPVALREVADAERIAERRGSDPDRRADAITLLSLDRTRDRRALLRSLITTREPEVVQIAALRALAKRPGAAIGRFLLFRWGHFTPAVRAEAADAMLDDRQRTRQLVEALADGRVKPWTLDFGNKRDLLMNRDAGIRARARELLEGDPARRAALVARYAKALDLGGEVSRGRQVFERACVACHAMGGAGGEVGPDLATIRHRPPMLLLGDILFPSQAIAQKYETYVVERASGATVVGVMAGQTPTAITLRQGPGQEITIARRDIRRLVVSGESSMPVGLDKQITPEEMADLIAFLVARQPAR